MNKIEELLERIGLKKNERSVYLYLLQSSAQSISDISRALGVHRPIIYKTIGLLEQKNIISLTPKGKHKLYVAENPSRLKNILKYLTIDLEEVLPDLEDLYSPRSEKPLIKFLEGKKGIGFVFMDVAESLSKGETFYRYTSEKDLEKVNSYLPKEYRKLRDEKKLERLVISNPLSGSKKKPRLDRFIKFLGDSEGNTFHENAIQLIYANKIALIDLNSETSLIIENKTLADFQKTIFKTLYKKL